VLQSVMMAVGGCGRASSSFVVAYPTRREGGMARSHSLESPASRKAIALTALGDKCLIVAFAK
jgi:hypothetical protein